MTEIQTSGVSELAVNYYRGGLYCSEAILRAFNEIYGLGLPDNALKIATGFGAGLSRSGCMCGTVAAAAMVLGLAAGRNKTYESESPVFRSVNKLHERFKNEHKALCCRVLTGTVVWGSSGHRKQCERLIYNTADWTEEILKNDLNYELKAENYKSAPPIKIVKYILSKLSGRNY